MNANVKTGVFLCECGERIAPHIDLAALQDKVGRQSAVAHCETLPFPCLRPGLDRILEISVKKKLNRLIIAGCEGRLMLKKFEKELQALELRSGQIDMVNLRGHIAAVSDLPPERNAEKAAKLIGAAAAEMAAMAPTIETRATIRGPVVLIGGGIAAYTAAQELARNHTEFILVPRYADPEQAVRRLHEAYPGERAYYDRLRTIVREVHASPVGTVLAPMKLTALSGVTGDFTLTLTEADGAGEKRIKAAAIIACIDAALGSPGPTFGHDGQSVLVQSEMEDHLWRKGTPSGRVVFWISDHESGQPEYAALSARSAWAMARHIRECSRHTDTVILYNRKMAIPLQAEERRINRELDILWIPYDDAVQPSVQDGFVSFCSTQDHLENEIPWDMLVLSPVRSVAGEPYETAKTLGLVHRGGRFLTGHHARVRPEMVGREETYLAGSGRAPCDLTEALNQGWRAARKTIKLFEKSAAGELFLPRVVCVVDQSRCVGCGQCEELCDCGGIGAAEGTGGGLPRVVDPMVCTGGGTCVAACPYNALILQNNTTLQREARVAALANRLEADEVLAYGCYWAGLPAADNAGMKGLKYDSRLHVLGIPCVGQLDPCIMARAFLEGAPGLLIIGCMPEDCHHSHGIDHAWRRVNVIKKLLTLSGFDRRRCALAHADLNRPEDFVRTVESFVRTIAMLGPIERTELNRGRLQAMYDLVKFNSRVRHLISAALRRPWEDTYRGDQRHALDYDRDFSAALTEEFLQQRLLLALRKEKRAFKLHELAAEVQEDQNNIAEALWGLIAEGKIDFSHKNREAMYTVSG